MSQKVRCMNMQCIFESIYSKMRIVKIDLFVFYRTKESKSNQAKNDLTGQDFGVIVLIEP